MSDARRILSRTFGFDGFMGQQEAVIDHVVAGGDAVVLMPTGGGKSLTYQIPAMVRPGVGLVVSPLIALMQDQVTGLVQNGVRAACLNSSLAPQAAWEVERAVAEGALDVLYVAPERAVRPDFLELLGRTQLSLMAIDEAHCVSQWGHDFRPEYTQLSILGRSFPGVPRMALTATADTATRLDIAAQLGLEGARVFATGFDRPNLTYTIKPKNNAHSQLLSFIRSNHAGESGIVYRFSRKKVESTAEHLRGKGIDAMPYHAGLPDHVRYRNQERFMREEGVVMVATIAFGMGVDKPNVRFVAHLEPPKSVEAYHQETGRAGRDGLPADAWMVYGLADVVAMRALMRGSSGNPERLMIEEQKLGALTGFLEAACCRRTALLGYFGEKYEGGCGNCDNCLDPPKTFDGTEAAQKALSNIYRTRQMFGAAHLTQVLLGKDSDRIRQFGHHQLSTFGIGEEFTNAQWRSIHRQLVAQSLVDVDPEHWNFKLNQASWKVLRGQEKVQLRLEEKTRGRRKRAVSNKAAATDFSADMQDQEARDLFEKLRELRLAESKKRGVPPYTVFADRTLLEMVRYRPENPGQMGHIHGIGAAKLEKYGAIFLQALAEHHEAAGRPENLPEAPWGDQVEPELPEPRAQATELSATKRESVDLFRELRDPALVARERGLKENTIMTHLLDGFKLGLVDLDMLLPYDEEARECIMDTVKAFLDEGFVSVTPAHEALAGKVPYYQLRAVVHELERGDGEE